MGDNVVKTCVICNTEKRGENFYRKSSERKECDFKRALKRYSKNKDEVLQIVEIKMHVLKTWILD